MSRSTDLFDAIISVGAFEHFCSEEEYNDGVQEEIYEEFFDFCADNLKPGGKIYLQTMMWGKKNPISGEIKLDAPEGSPEHILARLRKFYPGSWLPSSIEQIVKIADKRFRVPHRGSVNPTALAGMGGRQEAFMRSNERPR